MKDVARNLSVLVVALMCAIGSAGCAATPSAKAGGAPGMGMSAGGASAGMGAGIVAVSRDASMSLPVYDSTFGVIQVPRVLAPTDGWVVVRSTASTGGVLGYSPVRKGENGPVAVRLASVDGRQVQVLLFADRGTKGALDFNPDRPRSALDKPVIVDGVPVGFNLFLIGWGVEAKPNSVLVLAEDQLAGPTLDVGYLLTPAPSWVEVRRIEKGVPGKRLGVLIRPAGEFQRVSVPIEGAKPKDALLVTVLADRGVPGVFESADENPLLAIDQPWVSAGVVASQRVRIR